MQINGFSTVRPVNPRPVQNFTGTYEDKLREKVQGKEVFKDATNIQISALKTYIETQKYALGMTPQDVAELSKYDGNDFILKSYEYLINKLNIPGEIAPPFTVQNNMKNAQSLLMMYMPAMNIIVVNSDQCKDLDKTTTFKMLRHELQHYMQNINILRHETFGDEAIDIYKEKYMDVQQKSFDVLYANNMIPQLLQSPEIPMNEKVLLQYFKELKDANNTEGINALFENVSKDYVKQLTAFRDNVRKKLGVIPAEDTGTEKIKEYFNEFKNVGYFNPNGEVDAKKYFQSKIEEDACSAQERAGYEFSQQGCFIRYAIDTFENAMKSEQFKNEINKLNMQG